MKQGRAKREYVSCRRCPKTVRTRKKSVKESRVCDECIVESLRMSVPTRGGSGGTLEWRIMPEAWLHQLIFAQVQHNGLCCLGMGRLRFVDQKIQTREKSMGRYREGGNEYDLLLEDASNSRVAVEIKRSADDAAVLQCLRYRKSLRDNHGGGSVVLVAAEFQWKAMDIVEELWRAGCGFDLFRVRLAGDVFKMEKVEFPRPNSHGRDEPDEEAGNEA